MFNIILAIHIIVAIAMIGLILIQHGKGADAGASFGAGSSGTVFGAAGSANFLTRTTAVMAIIFFCTSLTLAVHASKQVKEQNTLDTSALDTSSLDTPALDTPVLDEQSITEPSVSEDIVAPDSAPESSEVPTQ